MKAVVSVLLFWALPVFAETAFEEGRALYDQGNFAEALADFQSIEGQSAALDYNIGNTLMRLGRPQEAIAFYRKAQWQDVNDPDIVANMDMAITETDAVVPPLPLSRRLSGFLRPAQWQLGFIASCWLFAGLGIAGFRFSSIRESSAWTLPLVGLLLIGGAAGVWASRPSRSFHEAVLKDQSVTALFEPLPDSTEYFSLPGGSVVTLLDHSRNWYKISAAEKEGWVQQDQLIELKEL